MKKNFGTRLVSMILAILMVASAIPGQALTVFAAESEFGPETKAAGVPSLAIDYAEGSDAVTPDASGKLVIETDLPVEPAEALEAGAEQVFTYRVSEADAEKVEIDAYGNLYLKEGYTPSEGETVDVSVDVNTYAAEDVRYYENFEPKDTATKHGELTAQSEYGRFEGNDWGAAKGYSLQARPYVITDTNPVEGGQASRTGRYGVTQESHMVDANAQAPYSYVESQPGTFVFWYYDADAKAAVTKEDRWGAGIPNKGGISDSNGKNPVRHYFAGMGAQADPCDQTHYGVRINTGNSANGTFQTLTQNADRATGWHKFEFRVDAVTGMTLWIDGQQTNYADAAKKSIEAVALGANFCANAENIRGKHFIDDMYVLAPDAKTEKKTLTVTVSLGEGSGEPTEPGEPDEFDALRERFFEYNIGKAETMTETRIQNVEAVADSFIEQFIPSSNTDRKRVFEDYPYSDYDAPQSPSGSGKPGHLKSNQTALTYDRLRSLAIAVKTPGSKYNTEYWVNEMVEALALMAKTYKIYESSNGTTSNPPYGSGYDWCMSVPQRYVDILTIMWDDLAPAVRKEYCDTISYYNWQLSTETGANLVWKAATRMIVGVLTKNAAMIEEAQDYLARSGKGVFVPVTGGDGYYADGSFIQHSYYAYAGGYGKGLVYILSQMMYLFEGSEFAIEYENGAEQTFYDAIFNTYEPLIYDGRLMDAVREREITRPVNPDDLAGRHVIRAIVQMTEVLNGEQQIRAKALVKELLQDPEVKKAIYTDPMDGYYAEFGAYMNEYGAAGIIIDLCEAILADDSIQPRGSLAVNKVYASMARVVHRTEDFGFSISMHNSRVRTYENTNLEGRNRWNIANGMTYLYNDDKTQYSDHYYAALDMQRLAGTTAERNEALKTAVLSDKNFSAANPRPFVGGVNIFDAYGVAGMDLLYWSPSTNSRSGSTVQKSWFMFDQEVLCLGSNINATTNDPVETILDNKKIDSLDKVVTVDGAAVANGETTHKDASWLHLEGNTDSGNSDVGYYFPNKETVNVVKETRTGAWSNLNGYIKFMDETPRTRTYATFYLNHGVKPKNDSYAYAILPGKTAAETEAYAENPRIVITAQSNDVHAAVHTDLKVAAANLWTANQKAFGLTTDVPASVMMADAQENSKNFVVSVADPTQQASKMTVVLDRPAKGVVSKDDAITVTRLQPTVIFTVDTNKSAGRAFQIELEKTDLCADYAYDTADVTCANGTLVRKNGETSLSIPAGETASIGGSVAGSTLTVRLTAADGAVVKVGDAVTVTIQNGKVLASNGANTVEIGAYKAGENAVVRFALAADSYTVMYNNKAHEGALVYAGSNFNGLTVTAADSAVLLRGAYTSPLETLAADPEPAKPVTPGDPKENLAPTAVKKEAANQWDAAHAGLYAADGQYGTRWAIRSTNGSGTLTLTFASPVTVNKAGINSYDNRLTGFRVEYLDGSEWKVAYTHEGTVTGVAGSASAASNTHYYDFPAVTAEQIRLVIPQTSGDPSIWEFELYGPAAAPEVLTETLENGRVDEAYKATLEASGRGPITWTVTAGTLPEGLSLSEDGVLSGTPAKDGDYTFTVAAANEAGAAEKALTLTILPPDLVTKVITVGAQSGKLTAGKPGMATLPVTTKNVADGTYDLALTGVPAGMTVSGKLTVADSQGSLTVTTTKDLESGSYKLTLTLAEAEAEFCVVVAKAQNKAYQTVNAENFDEAVLTGGSASANNKSPTFTGFGGQFKAGNYLVYKDLDFGGEGEKAYGSFMLNLSTDADLEGAIEARIDSPEGQLLATMDLTATGNVEGWPAVYRDHYATMTTRAVTGKHDVYLVFTKDVAVDLDFMIFSEYYKDHTPFNIRSDGYADENQPDLSKTRPEGVKYYFGDKEPARYNWLKDSHFAMFIHMGAYSEQAGYNKGTSPENPKGTLTDGEAEWIMGRSNPAFTRDQYREYVSANFRPENWDAEEVVKLAQAAGQKYIIITTRHHEGYAMWDTNVRWYRDYKLPTFTSEPHYYYTDNDPRNSSEVFTLTFDPDKPFDRDVVRELSDACKATYGTENEVRFGTYITIQDWNDPSQTLAGSGNTRLSTNPSADYNYNDLLARLKASIRELIEDYGAEALWFDGSGNAVSSWFNDGRGAELYEFARAIKPGILVNRRYHRGGTNDGSNPPRGLNHPWSQIDFHTPEQKLGPLDPRLQDFETCMTLGNKWGYRADDTKNKSTKTIVEYLVDCTAKGGNLLLNVGPDGDGNISLWQRTSLEEVGKWMDVFSESIYNTRKSPADLYNPVSGVYTTVNHNTGKMYIHLINYAGDKLLFPLVNKTIKGAYELSNGKAVTTAATTQNIYLDLSTVQRNDINTVIVLEYDKGDGEPLAVVKPGETTNASISIEAPKNNTLVNFPLTVSGTYAAEELGKIQLVLSGEDEVGSPVKKTITLTEDDLTEAGAGTSVRPVEGTLTNVAPAAPPASWKSLSFDAAAPAEGKDAVTVTFDFQRNDNATAPNTYVALAGSTASPSTHSHLPVFVRLNQGDANGYYFDAYNNNAYPAPMNKVYCEPNTAYHVKVEVNFKTDTYTVWVNGTMIAQNYTFRSGHQTFEDIGKIYLHNNTGSAPAGTYTVSSIQVEDVQQATWQRTIDLEKDFPELGACDVAISAMIYDANDGLSNLASATGIYRASGEDLAQGKTVTASSSRGGFGPEKAVNGLIENADRWAPSEIKDSKSWLAVHLGDTPVDFNKVIISEWFDDGASDPNYRSKGFSVDYKAGADADWETVYVGGRIGEEYVILLDKVCAATDVRLSLEVGADNSDGALPPNIKELEVYLVDSDVPTEPDVAKLELSGDALTEGEAERLLILDNQVPVDGVTYSYDDSKVTVDKDGTIRVKDGYTVSDGEKIMVQATVRYYGADDVLFYENFEPKNPATVSGPLTEESEYGRFEGNDWGASKGVNFKTLATNTEHLYPYLITDTNALADGLASYTGRYGVTEISATITGSQAPYSYLAEPQAGTMGFWYYDTNAESSLSKDDRFGAGIPNKAGINDSNGTNPARHYFAGMGSQADPADKTHYGVRAANSNINGDNGSFQSLNVERSKGWHKFEFKVDAETGMTLWVDGVQTNYKDANKKSIDAVALGANFAANALNIRGRHFVDDMYVVKSGAAVKETTLTTFVTLKSKGGEVEPPVDPIDPNKNIAPEADVVTTNNQYNTTTYAGKSAVDRDYNTRWATSGSGAKPMILELTFAEARNVYKLGINSFDSRVTGFDLEYFDGAAWVSAYHYEGEAIVGKSAGATAADTVFFHFAPHMSTQWRLKLNSFTKEPTLWEVELYEAPADMPFLLSAVPEQEITSAGGNVTLNVEGAKLVGRKVEAHVGDKTYEVALSDDAHGKVTLALPENTTEWDKNHNVTFTIDGKPAGLTVKLTVPGSGASYKLWLQYDSPAPDTDMERYNGLKTTGNLNWQNWTLPIGNGYQGANVYGLVSHELMQVSEESLWTGGLDGRYWDNNTKSFGEKYSDFAAIGLRGNNDQDITFDGHDGTVNGPAAFMAARNAALNVAGATTPPDNAAINAALAALFPKQGYTRNPAEDYSSNDIKQGRIALGYYKNFANVFYDFTHDGKTLATADVQDYHRWLDIDNAVTGVTYSYNGVTYDREAFASYPDRVIVTKLSASEAGKVNFTLNPVVPHETEKKDIRVTADAEARTIELSGAMQQNDLRFAAKFQIVTDGTVKAGQDAKGNGTLVVENATEAVVIMSLGTDYLNDYDKRYRTGEDPMIAVADRLEKAVKKGFAQLRADHVADYKSIFDNVTLDLGGEATNMNTDALLSTYRNDNNITSQRPANLRFLEELYFQYGRYLLIASSREGTLPANLQGVWNREQYPAWQGDYHLNINLQMNYWIANNTNMQDTLYALVDYMDSLRKPGRLVAYNLYGVGDGNADTPTGWVAHVSSNPFGFTGFFDWHSTSSAGHAQYSPESAMWMMQNIYNMYQYYPDEAYLRDRIYPMMREAALFYSDENILVLDPASGRMVMSPTYSSEHGPMWGGDTFQQQLLWQLFTDVIEASEILGVDGEQGGLREKLATLLPKLSAEGDNGPVPIGPTNGKDLSGANVPGVKEWWWETGYEATASGGVPGAESQHRHLSHLVGLFPGNLITKDTTEWMEAAMGSLTRRGDAATGWSRGMKTNLWARTGDGNHAYKIFDGLLASATLNNLWDYHDGPHFQIDGNFGGAAGMIEMLMQSHAGYIEPLPALPDAWPEGTVTGLTMRGGFTVDMTWADKAVTSMQVTSDAGQDCSVKYLDENGEALYVKVTCNGADVPVTRDEKGVSTFETVNGNVYDVTFTTEGESHEHKTEIQNAKEATCTEDGYTGDEVCTVCGETVKQGETIPALGHKTEIQNAKEATCTEAGYTGDEVCTVCGTTVKQGEVIPALGHKTERKNVKEATCEENGYTGDLVCTVCGDVVEAGEVILATGHTGGTATCKHKAVCEICGKAYGELDETNHEGPMVLHNAMEPTTEHDGYTGDIYCSACGVLLEKGYVIPKLPTDPEEPEKPEKPENPFIPNRPAPVKPVGPTMPEFPFTDVHENDWFYEEVKSAWENDLVDGVSADKYAPNETLTVASAIKLAAALHQMDNDGYVSLKNGAPVWYSTYVDYAVKNGVIEESYLNYTAAQMNAPVTRAEFIHIFYGAMDNYDVINDVKDGHIPDVKMADKYADEIYTFYRAGILTGCDSKGSCRPATVITRGEVAAILIRMYDVTARVRITL